MEAEVHQALGDIGHFDAVFLPLATIQDHLVRAAAVAAAVQGGVAILQRFLDVVRIQDGHLGCLGETLAAHHLDVAVRDEQDECAAVRRGGHRMDALCAADLHHRMRRQERCEVFCYTDGAGARSATAVWNGEGLV